MVNGRYNNDYGISEMARELGYEDEAVYYANRAMNYVNLFDKQSDDVNDMWFKEKMQQVTGMAKS